MKRQIWVISGYASQSQSEAYGVNFRAIHRPMALLAYSKEEAIGLAYQRLKEAAESYNMDTPFITLDAAFIPFDIPDDFSFETISDFEIRRK